MFRKVICLCVIIGLMSTFICPTYAADEAIVVRFDPIELSVSISGMCDDARDNQRVLAEVIDEHGTVVLAIQDVIKDKTFLFSDCLLAPDMQIGYYSVTISIANMEPYTQNNAFYFGGAENAIKLLNQINNATIESCYDLIQNNYYSLGFTYIEQYNKCETQKSLLLNRILNTDLSADVTNYKQKWALFLDIIEKDTLLTHLSSTKQSTEIKALLQNSLYTTVMGFDYTNNKFNTLTALSEDGIDEMCELIAQNSVTNLDDCEKMVRQCAFVAFLRTQRYTEVESAFKDNNDILQADFSTYNTLDTTARSEVMNLVASYAKTTSSSDSIVDYFEKEAQKKANQNSYQNNNNSQNGGGGGGVPIGPTSGVNSVTEPSVNPQENVTTTFDDIGDVEWAKTAIIALANKGVIHGVGDGKFAPHDFVTRAQFCKMVATCFNITSDNPVDFYDVDPLQWYAEYVAALAGEDLVSGVGGNQFKPNAYITRQDMAVILNRIISKYEFMLPKYEKIEKFSDDGDISEYAYDSIYTLYNYGVLSGSEGKILPLDNATRAEVAVLIYRIEVAR